MNHPPVSRRTLLSFGLATLATGALPAAPGDAAAIEHLVSTTVRPLMEQHEIPGMAVALAILGKRHVFHYGVASRETGQEVTSNTIFELGSVSKTFTATLASYAQASGALSFSEPASRYLPALAGSAIGRIPVLDLGTYTAGGLPLQFPRDVIDEPGMVAFFRRWRPAHPAGTHRLYSNPSMGLFGELAARSMGRPFDELVERKLLPMLGLRDTFIRVPQQRMGDYAWGYSSDGKAIRVNPGVFDAQAYGVKSTAADMLRLVEAHMGGVELEDTLQRAVAATRARYYRVGHMTQGLAWEMYAEPALLTRLVAGNSTRMALEAHKVARFAEPRAPNDDMVVNKTGSTNGFGAYVAFSPGRRVGIVLLANRNYPNADRVQAAYRILGGLDR